MALCSGVVWGRPDPFARAGVCLAGDGLRLTPGEGGSGLAGHDDMGGVRSAGIDEDHAGDSSRMGDRVARRDEATAGRPHEDVRTGDLGGFQHPL